MGHEFRAGMLADGITTEGNVKLKVLGLHGESGVIVEVIQSFYGNDVCHEKGQVFVADAFNLYPSEPPAWKEWQDKRSGHALTASGDGVEIAGMGENHLGVTFYKGDTDSKPVIQVDGNGDFRVNVNDSTIYDRHTESTPQVDLAAVAYYKFLTNQHSDFKIDPEELKSELEGLGFLPDAGKPAAAPRKVEEVYGVEVTAQNGKVHVDTAYNGGFKSFESAQDAANGRYVPEVKTRAVRCKKVTAYTAWEA